MKKLFLCLVFLVLFCASNVSASVDCYMDKIRDRPGMAIWDVYVINNYDKPVKWDLLELKNSENVSIENYTSSCEKSAPAKTKCKAGIRIFHDNYKNYSNTGYCWFHNLKWVDE